jgi:hypothetical protein
LCMKRPKAAEVEGNGSRAAAGKRDGNLRVLKHFFLLQSEPQFYAGSFRQLR